MSATAKIGGRVLALFVIGVTAVVMAVGAAARRPGLTVAGDDDGYRRLAEKSVRFFDNREWLNAQAMYTLMLERQPRRATVYAHAMVADVMTGDTVAAVTAIQRAMDHGVPLDSLLGDVRDISLGIGHATLYETLLLRAADAYPWLKRGLDSYLLDYYDFRNNGPMLVQYARRLLTATPYNLRYSRLLARGYMLNDKPELAADVWRNILSRHPDNYDTLLDLGNYYLQTGRRADALPLLRRAAAINSTPYLQSVIG